MVVDQLRGSEGWSIVGEELLNNADPRRDCIGLLKLCVISRSGAGVDNDSGAVTVTG